MVPVQYGLSTGDKIIIGIVVAVIVLLAAAAALIIIIAVMWLVLFHKSVVSA